MTPKRGAGPLRTRVDHTARRPLSARAEASQLMRAAHARSEPPEPRDASAFTVREALRLPELRRGLPEVLAGQGQLDRTVRWVHTGEVADIAPLLTGGELLLTTGNGVGATGGAQRRFVEGLAQRRTAALVVALGYAFERELPAPLMEAAHAADLPLVALHQQVPFVAVTEAMHAQIASSQYALLRSGEQIHRQLSALMLDGEGIPRMLAALADTLGAPVYLERGGRLLCHAAPASYELDPTAVWATARTAVDGVTVHETPVRIGRDAAGGRLLVADFQAGAEAIAQIALGHAADILALALLREREEEALVLRERELFLAKLADDRIPPDAVVRAALAAGLKRAPKLVLPVAARVQARVTLATAEWDAALREAERRVEDLGFDAVLGRRRGDATVLVLAALRDADRRAAAADAIAGALRRAHGERLGTERITVAAGRACPPEAAGGELRAAEEGAASAETLGDRPWHDVSTLELQRLLWSRREDAALGSFVRRTLGPLLDQDRRRQRDLLATLETLLDHGGHKAETARVLHLNRQALYNRLTRIEELLGVDLGDPRQALALHVALRARHYAGLDG